MSARLEDRPRVLGQTRYLDDLQLADTLHCAFVRSQRAHARVRIAGRLNEPGTRLFTAGDLPELTVVPVILGHDEVPEILSQQASLVQRHTPQPILATDVVRFAGEPLAVAVAPSAAQAVDVASSCEVEYVDLPVVTDSFEAQSTASFCLHPEAPRNRSVELQMLAGDAELAVATAEVLVEETYTFGRQSPLPLEPRGALAQWDASTSRLTMWSSTQIPHALRGAVRDALGISARDIHVITPEVGGGFGTKALVYPEELVVAALAMRLRRPIKWVETRVEHFVSAIHGRDQVHHITLGARHDGTLVCLLDDFVVDTGAYDLFGKSVPYNTAAHVVGPYRIPNVDIRGTQVVTNKVPCAPYRGSGRPEATFARERAMHCLARKLAIDPVELRRRNLIRADEMPFDTGLLYRDGVPLVYDHGDYHGCLEDALRLSAKSTLPPPAPDVLRSTGVACFVQSGGKGPWETALVEVDEDGKVLIATGAVSQGQAHETVWAKLCADTLGTIAPEDCVVRQGDTDVIAEGWGTMASRSAVNAGNAVRMASCDVRGQLEATAMELSPGKHGRRVRVEDGRWLVDGPHGTVGEFTLKELAREMHPSRRDVVRLRADAIYRPATVGWAFAAHVATVDIDLSARTVRVVDYCAAYDNGRLLDADVVAEQMIGGIVQGISGALTEELHYDTAGQLLNGLLTGYGIALARDCPPRIRLAYRETPTDRNPLGVKGVGESSIVGPAAAIGNAVADALASFGVPITHAPLNPGTIHHFLSAASDRPADAIHT